LALPEIQQVFDLDLLDVRILFVSFWFFDLAALLVSGRLSDSWSRQRVMTLGFGIFIVGSVMALSTPNIEFLVLARSVQGVGAGLMFGPTLAILTDNFIPARLGWIFGIWAAIGGVALAVAPLIGGARLEVGSWRWMFALTGLLAAIAFIAATRLKTNVQRQVSFRLDWVGIALLILIVGELAVALLRFEKMGTDAVFSGLVVSAVLLMIGFAFSQRRTCATVLPGPVVSAPGFVAGTTLVALADAIAHFIIATIVVLLYAVFGFTLFQTGAALLAYSVLWFAGSLLGGRLVDRMGIKAMAMIRSLVLTLGVLLLALTVNQDSYPLLAASLAVVALGNAALMPAANKGTMANIQPEDRGVASGSNMALRLAGALFGFAGGLALVNFFDNQVLPRFDLVSG
jgi:MFS family permease